VWSPDGQELAYMALRDSYYSVFRSAADGRGEAERLYRHPGGPLVLTDWSLDGRFLVFSAADLVGASLYVLPIEGDGEAHEIARSDSQLLGPRMSPDGRFVAYRSNETGGNEIFVRALPPPDNPDAAMEKWQVSTEGGVGMMYWRSDGNELYYLGADRNLMAVPIATDQGFEFGAPQPLFRVPDTIPVVGTPGGLGNISRDGERIVLAVPRPPQLQQITLYDRAGEVMGVVGEPGLYTQLALSHDGRRVMVLKQDLQIGTVDVWAYDIGTGAATQLTFDAIPEVSPTWSSDGRYISYVSVRETRAGMYRRRSDGSGEEELLFRYTPGAALFLTDYSPDGRFAAVDGGGILLTIPLSGETEPAAREPIEFSRDEFDVAMGRFSPDGRLMAYGSNETGRFEVYVRPFDSSTGEAAGNEIWQLSSVGALGGIGWRQDGKELYFLSEDIETGEIRVMAVEVSMNPMFQQGALTELFRVPGPPRGPGRFVSADGELFAFLPPLPRAPAR
jgi:Tol biopolymer transport system component